MKRIKEEERIAAEKEAKKRLEEARSKILAEERITKIKAQSKEYDKFSSWEFGAHVLIFQIH